MWPMNSIFFTVLIISNPIFREIQVAFCLQVYFEIYMFSGTMLSVSCVLLRSSIFLALFSHSHVKTYLERLYLFVYLFYFIKLFCDDI